MLTKRRVIAAKIEAVEGTGEALTAADGGILVIDPKVETDIKMSPRNPVMATLSKLADTVGSQLAKITFKVELKGAVPHIRQVFFLRSVNISGGVDFRKQ